MARRLWVTALLAAAAGASGCATTTNIHSDPEGAKLYLDGVYQGQTPVQLTLPDGTDYGFKHVRLEMDGYAPTTLAMGRRQDSTRLICGYFCLFPLLWVYKWDETYSFKLLHEGESAPTPAGGFAPQGEPKVLEAPPPKPSQPPPPPPPPSGL